VKLARRMERLGTESAFSVVAKARGREIRARRDLIVSGLGALPGVECVTTDPG
jgi:hypothetical protein